MLYRAIAGALLALLAALPAAAQMVVEPPPLSVIACSQMNAMTGDVTSAAGSCTLTIASHAVTLAKMAQAGANTVLGNPTGSTADNQAMAMPSCSPAGSALKWTTSTGFGCNSAIDAATLGGATFAAPGAIGGTTPGAARFSTSVVTISTTNLGGYTWAQLDSLFGLSTSGGGAFGWNYSGGGGEADLLINNGGGVTGGLFLYDFPTASGALTLIGELTPGGWMIGTATGDKKGAGTLNLQGSLYDNGTAPTGTSGYVRSTSGTLVTPILTGYAIGSLPAGTIGMLAYVTDQITACPALGVGPTSGGALKCRVWYNGAAWVGD